MLNEFRAREFSSLAPERRRTADAGRAAVANRYTQPRRAWRPCHRAGGIWSGGRDGWSSRATAGRCCAVGIVIGPPKPSARIWWARAPVV